MNNQSNAAVIQDILGGFDIGAFAKLKQEAAQKATTAIAQRIELVKKALYEIRDISHVTGVQVSLQEVIEAAHNVNEYVNPDWNSSSSNC